MFLDFYGMREQPFGGAPDPRFLYFGASHREALASLFYGIKSDCGFTALIAEPGLGKSTLTAQLLEKLRPFARTVYLCQTQCNSRELLQYILTELGTDTTSMETVTMHNKLKELSSAETLAGRHFIIAVDEAQNLDADVLETIRLLSNLETSHGKLIQILLVGQPQLARKLASPALMQLQQRIAIFARLEALGLEETDNYIGHRLQCAGYKGNRLFAREAVAVIHARSRGIPRVINNLCFNALSLGCAMERRQIDGNILKEVIADIDMASSAQLVVPTAIASAPVLQRPVISYGPAASKTSLGRWAMRTGLAVAGMAVAILVLSRHPDTIGRFVQIVAEVSASVRHSASPPPSTRDSIVRTSNSDETQTVKKMAIGGPVALQQSVPTSADVETLTVVVQPGDTLRQIALRTVGQYSDTIVEKIKAENPRVSDPNHIEAGQKITVSRTSVALDAVLNGAALSGAPKN